MSNAENLRDADVGPPMDGPASWIEHINSEWAWDDLAKLRRLSLQNGLLYLCDTVTNKMRKIDVARLARTVRAQIADAPESWRPRQSAFALECERIVRSCRAIIALRPGSDAAEEIDVANFPQALR